MEKNKNLDHVAIIMDGNGRWAAEHNVPRVDGHMAGADRVVDFMNYIKKFNIKYVTLYAFSTENWSRSKEEVDALMGILCEFLDDKLQMMLDGGIRLRVSGQISGLPEECQKRILSVTKKTEHCSDIQMILCLNYGGRLEVVDAVKRITELVKSGKMNINEIDESVISRNLYLPDVPDPDLIIRTSGELRLSNFLLWESSYSEFYFTDSYWPDFDLAEFTKAVDSYYQRKRRFGGRPC